MTAADAGLAVKAEVKNLSFFYGDFQALKGLNMRCTRRRSPR